MSSNRGILLSYATPLGGNDLVRDRIKRKWRDFISSLPFYIFKEPMGVSDTPLEKKGVF